ncbi:MAG: type II toxin-antitoxin system Phd/YefM family antitoxin [Propionibacteriaceae bacterium]|jgi:prevent-host-death family protein|nr:type II toxin-antitoxin system Phd/YefM family antitoxin [Propionibacteriaceae bacterium]
MAAATTTPVTVSATEASRRFADVIERARRGERFTITKNGRPVARVLPPESRPNGGVVLAFLDAWEGGGFDDQSEAALRSFRDPAPSDRERLAWADA